MSIDPMTRAGDAKANALRDRPALSARNAAKTYDNGAVIALNHVSLDIAQGEFFTLLGPSGSGKTTLLRLFAGFESPSRGAILLDGQDVTLDPPYKRPLNTVFQSYALFPHLTVAQNIAFGLEMKKTPKAEIAATVAAMLDLVQMRHLAARKPSQLSGGQQQRVALARALAPKPKVLLLDEPLSALDLKLRKEMQIELKRLQTETGITFVFVTHDQEEALTMSDRIAVLNGGEILQVGTPREIYERPANRFVAGFIGETNFLNAMVVGGEVMLSGQKTGLKPRPNATHMTLCLRPERLHFNPAKDDLVLQADVTQVVYFGTDSHVHATLTSGEAVVLRLQAGAELPEKGARITLGCQRAHLQPIEDETASGAA